MSVFRQEGRLKGREAMYTGDADTGNEEGHGRREGLRPHRQRSPARRIASRRMASGASVPGRGRWMRVGEGDGFGAGLGLDCDTDGPQVRELRRAVP
jgi:hypothetical protein